MNKKLFRIFSLVLAAVMLLVTTGCSTPADSDSTAAPDTSGSASVSLPWAEDTVDDNYRTFYQVFVGSFSDSNGDGIGDLQGVIQRFDYLNDGNLNSDTSLGVQGIWLSPVFSSPSYHKYDATDYYTIDSDFGTMEDLKELADLCEERNVKLILDLAINHTSTENEWFKAFKEARLNNETNNPLYDYYVCVTQEEKVSGRTYQSLGNGWYYECNFDGSMPELNFDNETVRREMVNIAKYYLEEIGVDGFRFDAVKYIYYGDTQKCVEFWNWYMAELKAICPDIYCVGECWSGETEILDYYEAMNCFNFAMSSTEGQAATAAKGGSIATFTNYIVSYQDKVQNANADGMPVQFLSNHDQDRIAGSFLSKNYMRMAANLYLLSPGSPVIYYGEEIGMLGSRGAANTDANRRLAMLWGDGDTVEDPVGSTYANQINSSVAEQLEDETSLLRYYCKLLSIRHRYPAIARGEYTALTYSKNFGGFLVEHEGEYLLILHNNGTDAVTVDLSTSSVLADVQIGALLETIGVGSATLEGTTLTISGYTSVVIG